MQIYISFLKKITNLITELELSLDKTDDCFINVKYSDFEKMVNKTKNYIKDLAKNENAIENEMEKYYENINLYISDINNIVLKKSNNNKIKIDEFNFLNEITLFTYFDFKMLNGLNKNTKIVIVQYLKNITDIVLAYKGLEPLNIIKDTLEKSETKDVIKKNKKKFNKKNKNLDNLITDIGGMVENLMKDGQIKDLVEDIKNDLESTNQDPMEIFQSLLSGKNNKFINNTMNKVKSKIDKGEINIDFNLDKHKDELNNIDINDISNMVMENIQKMNNKK